MENIIHRHSASAAGTAAAAVAPAAHGVVNFRFSFSRNADTPLPGGRKTSSMVTETSIVVVSSGHGFLDTRTRRDMALDNRSSS